jgi:hypothetical protein
MPGGYLRAQRQAKNKQSDVNPGQYVRGSGPVHLIGLAELIGGKSKEKPAGRVGIPYKGFDAGVCNDKLCAWDRSDLHGLLCRKTLEDWYLPAVLLGVSAQILAIIRTKSRGPEPGTCLILSAPFCLFWPAVWQGTACRAMRRIGQTM